MADRVFLLTGSPPELLLGITGPPQMVEDLIAIAGLPNEAVDRLATALDNAAGFLSEAELKRLAQDAIQTEAGVSAVLAAFRNIRPGRLDQIMSSLREWRKADAQNQQRLPDDTLATIGERLTRLIREYPAWERFRKARSLGSTTGNKAINVELICDARPVFDEGRLRVEGFIPLTTLKVVYETQTEETCCVEAIFSPKLLEELLEKARKAQQKISVLRDSCNQWVPGGVVDAAE